MIPEGRAREKLAEYCHMLYDRDLTASAGGNMSVRVEGGILITPSGTNKGHVRPEDMVLVGYDGKVIGEGKPSIETGFHLAIYNASPDTGAVLHCHPLNCIAVTLKGLVFKGDLTPEGVILLGKVPTIGYLAPGSDELVAAVEKYAESFAIVLDKHGAITRGRDLEEAFNRMEELEFQARLQLLAGGASGLSAEDVRKVEGLRK